jgi:hypothetical protein
LIGADALIEAWVKRYSKRGKEELLKEIQKQRVPNLITAVRILKGLIRFVIL